MNTGLHISTHGKDMSIERAIVYIIWSLFFLCVFYSSKFYGGGFGGENMGVVRGCK